MHRECAEEAAAIVASEREFWKGDAHPWDVLTRVSKRIRAAATESAEITIRVYRHDTERYLKYLKARFSGGGERGATFEFEGHRWKYSHDGFDGSEFDVLSRPQPQTESATQQVSRYQEQSGESPAHAALAGTHAAPGSGWWRCYLAGPMRGIPEYNFPAFFAAATSIRDRGIEVWSPAENDVHQDGFDPVKDTPRPW